MCVLPVTMTRIIWQVEMQGKGKVAAAAANASAAPATQQFQLANARSAEQQRKEALALAEAEARERRGEGGFEPTLLILLYRNSKPQPQIRASWTLLLSRMIAPRMRNRGMRPAVWLIWRPNSVERPLC